MASWWTRRNRSSRCPPGNHGRSSVVPYSPLWVIYHFVTRDTISGGPMGVDQKISREDALRMVTRNHWYLTFQEHTKGISRPGGS